MCSSFRIHLLNLRDGSPYCPPPSNPITWTLPQGTPLMADGKLAITGSRVMATLSHLGFTIWTVLVWDRRTGDLVRITWPKSNHIFLTSPPQVLNLPITDWIGLNPSRPIFLDGFRIMVPTHDTGTNVPEFIVFNTLIPQDHPMNSRWFSLPPQYHDRNPITFFDRDRSLGTLNSDGPIIADPTQAILVVRFSKPDHRDVLLVVRMQALIEHVCSARADVHIPWNEWGRGAVVMEGSLFFYKIYVHGTHLVMVTLWPEHGLRYRVRTFDFSRHGCGDLPLWDDKVSRAERVALFSDGTESTFEEAGRNGRVTSGIMGSQGNGNFYQVSYLSHSAAAVS